MKQEHNRHYEVDKEDPPPHKQKPQTKNSVLKASTLKIAYISENPTPTLPIIIAPDNLVVADIWEPSVPNASPVISKEDKEEPFDHSHLLHVSMENNEDDETELAIVNRKVVYNKQAIDIYSFSEIEDQIRNLRHEIIENQTTVATQKA